MKNKKIITEHKKWKEYKKWQEEHASEIREGQEIKSLGAFKEAFNNAGRNLNVIKSVVRFQVNMETWRAFNAKYKDITGKRLSPKFRRYSTQDLADMLYDDIMDFRRQQQQNGMSNKDINKAVSAYFFGS